MPQDPQPRYVKPSGLAYGADELFQILAEREQARILAAKAAEDMRRQLVTEAAGRATARRDDDRLNLEYDKFDFERNKPPELKIQDDGLDAAGNRAAVIWDPRSGKFVNTIRKWTAPERPLEVKDALDDKGKPGTAFLEPSTLARRGFVPTFVKPETGPRETFGQPFAAVDPATQRLGFYRGGSTGSIIPVGGLQPERSGTEAQGKAALYESMMSDGAKQMDAYTPTDNDLKIIHELADIYDTVKIAALSPAGQNFIAGTRVYLEGLARGVSGAAIINNEWRNFRGTFLPISGEDINSRTFKNRARHNLLGAMAIQSGPLWEKIHGHAYISDAMKASIEAAGTPADLVRGADGKLGSKGTAPASGAAPPAPARGATPARPMAPVVSHAPAAPASPSGALVRGPDGKLHPR